MTVLRVEVSEDGHAALPAIDVDDGDAAGLVIGSATHARIRLPANAVEREHIRIAGGRWRALAAVKVDGALRDGGDIGDGVTLQLGNYRVRLSPAPDGVEPAPVQRTESLARELMRNMLGTAGAPTLEIERGRLAGAKRMLAPPESTLVIGRGDDAHWIIDDKDLSRTHAEVRRGWDGTRIFDLDSKNGTKVDGDKVTGEGMALRDGCVVELGPVVMRFRDPAEKYLQGDAPAFRPLIAAEAKREAEAKRAAGNAAPVAETRPRAWPFYLPLAMMALALVALAWILAG